MIIASFLELIGLGMVLLILNSFLGLANTSFEIINDYIKLLFKTEVNFELIFILCVHYFYYQAFDTRLCFMDGNWVYG